MSDLTVPRGAQTKGQRAGHHRQRFTATADQERTHSERCSHKSNSHRLVGLTDFRHRRRRSAFSVGAGPFIHRRFIVCLCVCTAAHHLLPGRRSIIMMMKTMMITICCCISREMNAARGGRLTFDGRSKNQTNPDDGNKMQTDAAVNRNQRPIRDMFGGFPFVNFL